MDGVRDATTVARPTNALSSRTLLLTSMAERKS